MKTLVITSGSRKGIGLEVSLKGLVNLKTKNFFKDRSVILIAGSAQAQQITRYLGQRSLIHSISTAKVVEFFGKPGLHVVTNTEAEFKWFSAAVGFAAKSPEVAVVTGPMNKDDFPKGTMGHTGYLSAISGQTVIQGYLGKHMNCVIATDHKPLCELEKSLDRECLNLAITAANQLKKLLRRPSQTLPIAILGLNPHAGENGMIGTYEESFLKPFLSEYAVKEPDAIKGPLAADTAFTPFQRKSYSVYVALYHDQGLIPFKTLHGQSGGFQISLNCPLVRTSVDHGTAENIFEKNEADPGSMIAAIQGADRALSVLKFSKGGF